MSPNIQNWNEKGFPQNIPCAVLTGLVPLLQPLDRADGAVHLGEALAVRAVLALSLDAAVRLAVLSGGGWERLGSLDER